MKTDAMIALIILGIVILIAILNPKKTRQVFKFLLGLRYKGPIGIGIAYWRIWVPVWIINKVFKLKLEE